MLRRRRSEREKRVPRPPEPHPSGAVPPQIPAEFVPKHIAIVMDGNGRWANQRGLSRVEGHKRGEQRTSNYLIWQSSYAEMVFQDVLWPDFDRRDLWRACVEYASRDRRFGGAVPNEELLAMEAAMEGRTEG